MSEEKFELISESKINFFGIEFFRIKALVDGKYYKKGEVGGFVESLKLKNGDARVYGDAWVYGDARVYGNAVVSGDALVYGNARVYGNAVVSGRFDLEINCDFELPRILINTKEKLKKLKDFLENFNKKISNGKK